MRRVIGLVLIPAALVVACGEDAIDPLTGGEGNGATGFSVFVTDDPANDPSPGGDPSAIDGVMEGGIRVSLRNSDGDLVELGLMQDAAIALQEGGDSLRLTDLTRPPTDEYVAIQLRFEGVTVTVESGSEVGDSTITSDVVMNVGSAGLATVEIATTTFDVDSETDMDIVVDLNSELWVTGDNLDDNLVPQADIANGVSVEIP